MCADKWHPASPSAASARSSPTICWQRSPGGLLLADGRGAPGAGKTETSPTPFICTHCDDIELVENLLVSAKCFEFSTCSLFEASLDFKSHGYISPFTVATSTQNCKIIFMVWKGQSNINQTLRCKQSIHNTERNPMKHTYSVWHPNSIKNCCTPFSNWTHKVELFCSSNL